MTALLSNPVLDELYNIRRILVGRHNAVLKINDEQGIHHYKSKVDAMDEAILAFINVNSVPPEHVEQTLQERARQALGVRIPPAGPLIPTTES